MPLILQCLLINRLSLVKLNDEVPFFFVIGRAGLVGFDGCAGKVI